MSIVKSCCGCCSLRTGTIIIGAVGIAMNIIMLIILLAVHVKVKAIVLESISNLAIKVIYSINLIVAIVVSCLLIVGAVKRIKWFLLPAVVLNVISIVALLVSVIYTSIEYYLKHDNLSGTLWIIFGLAALGLEIYMWLVILSYYLVLRDEGRGPYERPGHNG